MLKAAVLAYLLLTQGWTMRLIHTDRQVEVLVDASVAQGFPVIEYAFPGGTESCEARTVTTAHASLEPEDILIRWGS